MNRIKEVLEEKGIKQTWLAEKLGKSYNMVNGYVQNRQQPRLEVLVKIALILDIGLTALLVVVIYAISWKVRKILGSQPAKQSKVQAGSCYLYNSQKDGIAGSRILRLLH